MRREYRFIFFICFGLLFSSCSKTTSPDTANPDEVIKQREIENIVSTLSDNDMMGRAAFTDGSKMAADYIAQKFEEANLELLDGQSNYFQTFSQYLLRPESSSLQLNGETVNSDSFFVDTNHENLNWPDLSSFNTIVITADDLLGNALSEIQENTIVLVDPSHQESFEQYAHSYGGIKTSLSLNDGPSKLFVLTSATSINGGAFTYTANSEERTGYNVTGKITGNSSPDEQVLFGAHYDHIGYLEPVNGDSIANGANDNASGTAALIMLAKYFKELDPQRTLIFAAFTAEEMGLYGSHYYSQQVNPEQITAMINMDMLGKPARFGPNTAFLTGFDRSDLGEILQSNLEDKKYRIFPDPYPNYHLFSRSDNIVFANLGIPAHTISTVQIDTDQHYHSVDDEINTLDLGNLTNVTKAIAIATKSVVDGSDTPSRIEF